MGALIRDLRLSLRRLRSQPGFTAVGGPHASSRCGWCCCSPSARCCWPRSASTAWSPTPSPGAPPNSASGWNSALTALTRGRRVAPADALIAQCCIDHAVPLITRDQDFVAFVEAAGLEAVLA